MNEVCVAQDGKRVALRRHPHRPGSSLQAWDAADLLLYEAIAALPASDAPLLLIGDSQGALATLLAPRCCTSVLDRHSSRVATAANLTRNDLDPMALAMLDDTTMMPTATDERTSTAAAPADARLAPPGLIVMKVPRANDLLELRLRWISTFAPPGTPVIAGVMARRLSRGAIGLFERLFGSVDVSRAAHKARVLRSTVGPERPPARLRNFAGPHDLALHSWPPVFGAGRLDKGAAALLAHIPSAAGPLDVVDLGCGTGVLGLAAAVRVPAARLVFVDDSALAIDSARRSWSANSGLLRGRAARFVHADDLGDLADSSVDLVLCNPPFHQEHAVTRQTAGAMFRDARRVLRSGGALLVVGNRHLGYDVGLKRRFGGVQVLAADRRFVVLRARC